MQNSVTPTGTVIKMKDDNKCWQGHGNIGNLVCCWCGHKMWSRFLQKSHIDDPAVPFRTISLREMTTDVRMETRTSVCIPSLSIRANTWGEQPKYRPASAWARRMAGYNGIFPVAMYRCESGPWRPGAEELMLSPCGAGEGSRKSLGHQGDPTSPS